MGFFVHFSYPKRFVQPSDNKKKLQLFQQWNKIMFEMSSYGFFYCTAILHIIHSSSLEVDSVGMIHPSDFLAFHLICILSVFHMPSYFLSFISLSFSFITRNFQSIKYFVWWWKWEICRVQRISSIPLGEWQCQRHTHMTYDLSLVQPFIFLMWTCSIWDLFFYMYKGRKSTAVLLKTGSF